MTVTIGQTSVHGAGGAPTAGEDLMAYAEVTNDGPENARVEVTVSIDSRPVGNSSLELLAGDTQWVQVAVGLLASGGHDLTITGDVDDGMSSSQASDGISFQVEAAPLPTVSLGEPQIRVHTNVVHEHGQAWTGEPMSVWTDVTNTGAAQVSATVWVADEAGQGASHELILAPAEQGWVQQDFEALPAGTHTFTVSVSAEAEGQSVLLGQAQASLAVTEPAAGYRLCNVQLTLQDFRGQAMAGRSVFVQFYGMDGSVAEGAELASAATTHGGVLTHAGVMIPPSGSMRVWAVPEDGTQGLPIDSSVRYHLAEGQTDLGYLVVQEHEDQKVRARSLSGVRDKLSGEGHAGLEIEVLSVGGSMASEAEQSQEYETEVEWTVRVGRAAFTFTPDST